MSADTKYRVRAVDETAAATRSAARNFGSVDKAVGALRGGLAALGAALGVGALAAFSKSLLDNAGDLYDLSAALGISASKLSEMQYAAKLGGVELEGLGTALRFMERSVAAGDRIFERLGVSVEDLQGMAPDQAFLRIADAVSNLKSEYDRTEASMRIFGRSGAALLPVVEGGSKAILEMGQHARETGAALDDMEIASLAEVGDQLDALGAQIKGVFTSLLADVGPALASFFTEFGPSLIYGMEVGLQKLVGGVAGLAIAFKSLPLGGDDAKINEFLVWAERTWNDLEKSLAGGVEGMRQQFEAMVAALRLPEAPLRERTGDLKDVEAAARVAKEAEQELAALRREAKQITDQVATAEEKYNAALHLANLLLNENLISLDVYKRYLREFDEELAESQKAINTWNREFSLIGSAVNTPSGKRAGAARKQELDEWGHFFATIQLAAAEAAEGMDEAFTDALFDMKNAAKILEAYVTDAFKSIANALVAEYITGPLRASAGLLLPQTSARASGGPVLAGHPYMVGERGPELFVPSNSGRIVPGAGAAAAGAASVNVTFNVQAIDSQSFTGVLAQHERQLVAVINRAFNRM